MSSPFDVEPPRWLQQATQSNYDESGAGVGLAGLANAISGGKSLGEGIGEARMNIQDPQWKLKAEGMKANIFGQITQNELQYSKLKEQNKELEKRQKDMPDWSSFMALPTDKKLTEPMPVFESMWANETAQQSVRQAAVIQNQKTTSEIKLKQAENQSTIGKITTKVQEKALKDIDNLANDEDVIKITKMVDDNGLFTPEAISALRNAPKKDPVAVRVAALRADERKNIVQIQIDARKALQEQHHLNNVDLQKLKNLPRVGADGKPVSESVYVNRHMNTAIKIVDDNWSKDHPKEPKSSVAVWSAAQDMLRNSFRALGNSAPDEALLDLGGFQDPNKATGNEGVPLNTGQSAAPFTPKTTPDAPAAPSKPAVSAPSGNKYIIDTVE